MKFKKKYHNGEFRDLVKMLSFDIYKANYRDDSWNETKQIAPGIFVLVGESVVLPQNS